MLMDVHQRGNLRFPQSLPEFQRLFPDDAACAGYLEKARWSDGFVCPHCQAAESRSASQIVLASCAAASAAVTPVNAFRSLLGIAGDVTAPTYAELYSGAWQHPTCWGCG